MTCATGTNGHRPTQSSPPRNHLLISPALLLSPLARRPPKHAPLQGRLTDGTYAGGSGGAKNCSKDIILIILDARLIRNSNSN